MAMVAKLWTLNGLATELGFAHKKVSGFMAGVPADGQGHGGADAWLMKTAVSALIHQQTGTDGQKLDPAQERARKDKELADKAAMENRVRRGEVLERSDVDAAMIGTFARVRAKLLSIPSKSAPLAAQAEDIAEIEHLIRSQVVEALQELADTNVAELETDHSAVVEGIDAAA